MWYEVHILDVGDADAIVIKYQADLNSRIITAVIDAGNEGDGEKVLKCVGMSGDERYHIDYAFCTHPDKDHKGGFFDILGRTDVDVGNFYAYNLVQALSKNDFARIQSDETLMKKRLAPFNKSDTDSTNLLNIARLKGVLRKASAGIELNDIPIRIMGPSDDFYRQCAIGIASNYAEVVDEPDFEPYDENAMPEESAGVSVIDEDDDDSYTNQSSMLLLFEPSRDRKFLFLGDAGCSAIENAIEQYGDELKGCALKVPHHGSKHNLNTKIIDELEPRNAVISARGSRKHPNVAIVYSLSRYCNVYSTHKSKGLVYGSNISGNATPLRAKMKEN